MKASFYNWMMRTALRLNGFDLTQEINITQESDRPVQFIGFRELHELRKQGYDL